MAERAVDIRWGAGKGLFTTISSGSAAFETQTRDICCLVMGQSINDIRHMRDLAQTLRKGAKDTKLADYAQKLLRAAYDLDAHADLLSKRDTVVLG